MKKIKTFIANNRDGFIALLFSTTLLFLLSFKIDIINPNLTNFQWTALRTIVFLVLILLWKKLKYLSKNRSVLWRILFRFCLNIYHLSIPDIFIIFCFMNLDNNFRNSILEKTLLKFSLDILKFSLVIFLKICYVTIYLFFIFSTRCKEWIKLMIA